MPQTYVLTLKIAVPMPDPVDHPQEMEETAAFIRAAKKGDWPGNLPPGAVVESVRVNGPINRRIFL